MHKIYSHIEMIIAFIILSVFTINTQGNQLDSNKWSDIQEKYDYTEKDKKPEEKKKEKKKDEAYDGSNFNFLANTNFSILKNILYVVVVIGIVIGLVRLINEGGLGANFSKKLKTNFDINNPDKLERIVLEKGLQEALTKFNYRKALRFQFLILLEKMQKEKLIVWQRYKTNGEYLREISQEPIFKKTKYLTYAYEYYWYGEHELDKENYSKLERKFNEQCNLIFTNEK